MAAGAAFGQGGMNLNPSADAYIQDASAAGTNFGTVSTLLVKAQASAGNRRISFLRFTILGVHGTITGAHLRLYGGNSTPGYSGTDTVYAVPNNKWTETGVTWNNPPPIGSALSTATVTSVKQYVSWDVGGFVANQQSLGQTAVSLAVVMDVPTDKADSFNSREAASNPPVLALNISPPASPAQLTATAGTSLVSLSWPAVNGAVSYNISRATTSGGPYSLIASTASTTYTDVNVVSNTAYYYVVSAVNSGGEGGDSPEATATPLPPLPSAPSKAQATPGDTQIAVSWSPVNGAAYYRLYRSLSPHGEGAAPLADNLTATAYTDTGLTDGVTYYYQISAVNAAGEGPRSNETSAVPQPAAPAAPTSLVAVPGNQSVSLFWQAVPTADSYNVKRAFGSEGPYTTIATITKTKFTDAGLTNGVPYYYIVSASNAGGEGQDSNDVSATPGLTTYIVPIADSYVRTGSYANTNFGTDTTVLTKNDTGSAGRITYLKFDLSTVPTATGTIMLRLYGRNNGSGYSATDTVYAVSDTTWSETGITYNNRPAVGTAINSSTITSTAAYNQFDVTSYVKSLIASGQTTASFAVLMDNKPPNSQANIYQSREGSKPPQLAFTLNPPGTPTGLTAVATPGQSQVVLQWTAATGAVSYNIKRAQTSGGPYTTIAGASATTYTDNNLTNGSTYYYVVSAVSGGGESGNSNEASAAVPNVYQGSGIADSYVQSGTPSTNYGTAATLVVKNGNGGSTTRYAFLKFDVSNVSGPIGSAVLRLNGKNGGSGYTGTDTVYGVADTTWSETGITYANKPAIGSAVASATITSTAQWYTWNVSSYVLQQIAAGAKQVSFAVEMNGVPANSQADSFSSKEGANPPQLLLGVTPPAAPAALTATAPVGQGSVALSWTGSATAVSYNVKRATVTGGPYTTLTSVSGTTYTDASGTPGTTYYYIVTAVNPGGESPNSNEASATPSVVVLTAFAVTPNSLAGGGVANATVRLNGPAPAAGVTIALSSDQACATLPASVTIAGGQTSVNVTVNTTAVTQLTTANLTATAGAVTLYTSLTVNPPPPPLSVNINFQPATSSVPSGYVMDIGQPYSDAKGFGWVREDSLQGTHVPLDLTLNTRDRKRAGIDPRLNTIIHMQYPAAYNTPGVTTTPGAWEYALPNGTYQVTVSVGDVFSTQTNSYDSLHTIDIEGANVINRWQGSSAQEYLQKTVTTTVTDGKLTIDAIGGFNTKLNYVQITNQGINQLSTPSVTGSAPADGDTGVDRSTAVSLNVSLPNLGAGVDTTTLTSANIALVRVSDSSPIVTTIATDAAGGVIIVKPQTLLDPNTLYRLTLTSGVRDTAGAPFSPFTMQFTTGNSTRVPVDPNQFSLSPVYSGDGATTVKIGPDHKLYAAFLNGNIGRWTINGDGTLSNEEIFAGFAGRALIGLAFDPSNPNKLWVVNNDPVFPQPASDFTGHISQFLITGPGFTGTVQDYIVGLPRSAKDHMTSSLAFGPDGFLYCTQASDSSMGAPDSAWFNRPERLLNAAVLRIDPTVTAGLPINVQTEAYNGTTGSYDPSAPGAPVTLYATGLRNAYDLVWHSNGSLYCPTNGPSAGGSTPASPTGVTPVVPALTNAPAMDDYLFKVVQGKYYGHPNPLRGQYVLDGGNPTADADPAEVISSGIYNGYPVGVLPDANYGGFNWDLGLHVSADGVVEYKSATFGGALQHRLLITEYSAGADVVSVSLDSSGNATAETQVASGFQAPLGIVEDTATGNLYVADLIDGGASGQIDLLRPNVATIGLSPKSLVFNGVVNAGATTALPVTVANTGQAPLTVPAGGITLGGTSPGQFQIVTSPGLPLTLAAGQSATVTVDYIPTVLGPVTATLQVQSNDPHNPTASVLLSGLGAAGLGGSNEPSLQWILNTLGYGINVGSPDPTNPSLPPTAGPIGDEIIIQRFAKASAGQVTITPLAAFGPQDTVSGDESISGWYHAGDPNSLQQLFAVPNAQYQSLDPVVNGVLSFDPGGLTFGMYTTFPFFSRTVYQEDALNTFTEKLPPHHVRIFPAKHADGTVEKNAYVMTFEDSANSADFNDLVYLIENVRPASGHIAVHNLDGFPSDTRFVFNRIGTLANPPTATNAVHDTDTAQIVNTGIDPLNVTGIAITGPWVVGTSVTLPVAIAPGASFNLPVKFVAESGRISTGSLTIQTDDTTNPSVSVQLAGYWQSIPEGNPSQEPTFPELVSLYGYSTVITYAGQKLNNGGHVEAVGEEVLSPYWKTFDSTQPVFIRQINAFHTTGKTTTIRWYPQSDPTSLNKLFVQDPIDSQTLLPRLQGLTGPAQQSFTPGTIFGWKFDGEWSDPTLNTDPDTGAPPTGHHVRVWPIRDANGFYIPHTWIVTMDYGGGNFDYNDNCFLISNVEPANPDPARFVNPFVGTSNSAWSGNYGGTFPGAQVPFGMVQLSPDTPSPNGGGYNYNATQILGFSHTHLSGPGGPAYGDISFLPTTGQVTSADPTVYGSVFTHDGELASPGYYKVSLPTYGVQAELTATPRTGWHRYTFPATTSANIMIDTAGSLRGNATSTVNVVDSQTVEGSATSWAFWNTATGINPTPYTVYFSAKFSQPFTASGTWDSGGLHAGGTSATGAPAGAYITFDTTSNPVVVAKVGISFTSLAEARSNLSAETSDFNFDAISAQARTAWNAELNKVEVAGGTPTQQIAFHTALYHTLMHPNLFSDVDGSYLGFDGQVHQNVNQPDYANFSLWDTYRTEHPLLALTEPAKDRDMMGSLMRIYREGGWLPHWSFGNVETNEMIGDPALPALVDAYFKGVLSDTPSDVYNAAVQNATQLPPSSSQFWGRVGLNSYVTNGYVPYNPTNAGIGSKLKYGTSITLEYGVADGALSLMANALGLSADAATFGGRAHDYRNLFDPATGYIHPKMSDGTFLTPFDPTAINVGFKEGSAAQYTWMAQQDPLGLANLFGGTTAAAAQLDTLFSYPQVAASPQSATSLWGTGASYDPTNEHDIHVPYLYNYFGQPWKTQTVVRAQQSLYTDGPDGLSGNDDLGALSAWYVLSAIGLYPSMPGDPFYSLSTPLFPSVVLHLDGSYYSGQTLNIQTPGVAPSSYYIQSASLNGQAVTNTWLPQSAIQTAGTLTYAVGPSPSQWGTAAAAAPPDAAP